MFQPLLEPARYKGAFGGRGSGKSHFFAGGMVEQAILRPGFRGLCVREVQRTLKQSAKRLIEDKIEQFGVGHLFDCQNELTVTPGGGSIIYAGMNDYTADSIKSLEGIDVCWGEEAHKLSQRSIDLLRPTIRKPGSELWFSWNPEVATDPVDVLLRGDAPPRNSCVVRANYTDNPWFPDVLRDEMEGDRERDVQKFGHTWLGDYLTLAEAIVFRNRVTIEPFEEIPNARLYFGADWGFSKDPTALIRFYIEDECLFITHEVVGAEVEIEDLPTMFTGGKITDGREFDGVPDVKFWPIKADSARPETISYMRRRDFQIDGAKKWSGSVEDGIAHLKGFRRIVIHPRCEHTAREFRVYSYKVDKLTGDVLPILLDKDNHTIDAIRYGLDGVIQQRGGLALWERLAG